VKEEKGKSNEKIVKHTKCGSLSLKFNANVAIRKNVEIFSFHTFLFYIISLNRLIFKI
jgi:hypothetical protein